MFSADDFKLSLEAQLKLRVITDEVDNCTDVKELQTQLKHATELMMKYQHILHRLLKEQITKNLTDFTDKIEKGMQRLRCQQSVKVS